ncbi:zf-HC2 domain-containing protein [Streptosporangium sp. NPDC051022]|uniref:anti-sigma factor family protein n=1 Tax=Streptosporangium sp. NPDC051022 TaxID=3155752 RepID=UPI0034317B18
MKRFSCDEWAELITAYLENDIDEPTRGLFEEHLTGCEACENYLHQFRVTVNALGTLGPEPLSGDMRDRLMSAFRNRRDSRVEDRSGS